MPHGLPWHILPEQGYRALGSTTHKEQWWLSEGPSDERAEGTSSTAPEGVEGLAELHLHSDALRISKHARRKGGANTATAS
jgi:hypothetical protein